MHGRGATERSHGEGATEGWVLCERTKDPAALTSTRLWLSTAGHVQACTQPMLSTLCFPCSGLMVCMGADRS